MTLTVGQKLWFVPADWYRKRQGYEVTVLKIGRKWVQISHHLRIDIKTMWVDGKGYASPGRCWLSEAEWWSEQCRQLAWSQFHSDVRNHHGGPPDHLTTSRIENMRAWLKGEKPNPNVILEEIVRLAQLVTKEDVLNFAEAMEAKP